MFNKISSNPKLVSLIDGSGAILTAFSLGFIMIKYNTSFGMPKSALYFLAGLAVFFAVYSLSNFFFKKENWKIYLRTIISLNLTYCILSIGTVIYFFSKLTALGLTYFILEVIVVCGVIYLESITLSKLR